MRSALLAIGLALSASGCTNCSQQERGTPALVTVESSISPETREAGTPAPAGRARERVTEHGETFDVERASFSLHDVTLGVVDLGRSRDIGAALVRAPREALFAVNGGFFGDRGEPLGLVVSEGRRLAPFSKTMSGGVLVVDGDRATLFESETFDASVSHAFAIQCRPRLVVRGAVNIRSDDGKRAERSALCLRSGGSVLDVVVARSQAGGPSLLAMAEHLGNTGCEDALNLDGGPSTGIAWKDDAGIHAEDPRGTIRHALVVSRREQDP